MKRTITAAVAAATALTLVTTPAFAAEGDASSQQQGQAAKKKPSEVSDAEAIQYAKNKKAQANGIVKPALEKQGEEQAKALKPLVSSLKSDAAQGWEPGKTAAILIGTLVPAGLLALFAFFTGGGFQLPALPF